MFKINIYFITLLLFLIINNIYCESENGTGGKLVLDTDNSSNSDNSNSSNSNNSNNSNNKYQNKIINHHSHNHGYHNSHHNNKQYENYIKKHNHSKSIVNENEINTNQYRKSITIYREDIERKETVEDYNGDVVDLNCFKVDNIKIYDITNSDQDSGNIKDQEGLTSNEKENQIKMKSQQMNNSIKVSNEIKENIKYHLDWNYLESKWRCVDSFNENSFSNFNTFGGSLGEFMVAFHLFQDQTNQRIDDDENLIYQVMKKFLNNNPDSYLVYHSSLEVYEKFAKTIKNSIDYYNRNEFNILNVEKEHQSFALRLLKNPEFIGCKFIKQLVIGDNSGTLNSISPILVKNVLDSYFKILWNDKQDVSNILFEIDDHNEMVSIAEVIVNPLISCKKKPLSFPNIQQRLNHNNPFSHKIVYIVQDDQVIRLGIRDKIAKYFYGELLCDEHHLEQHRKKELVSFDDFKESLNNNALVFRESCINNIKKGNEQHYRIEFNIDLPKPLNNDRSKSKSSLYNSQSSDSQIKFNRNSKVNNSIKKNSPFSSQQIKDVQELLRKDNDTVSISDSSIPKQKSSIGSFFSGLFIVFIVALVGSTLVFGYKSYKKKYERYKFHKRLDTVLSLEDDFEDEFDL